MGCDITFGGPVGGPNVARTNDSIASSNESTAAPKPQMGLLDLPVELVIHILGNVPWEDYYSLKQTSHILRDLADAPKTLSDARYSECALVHSGQPMTGPPAPRIVSTPTAGVPESPHIHKILECASIRRGQSYFGVSQRPHPRPGNDRKFGEKEMVVNKSRISRSPFRNDPLCKPSVPELNVLWANGDEVYSNAARHLRYEGEAGTWIMNGPREDSDLVIGTGFREENGELKTFVTVDDLFKSFRRCRPGFVSRKSGRVKFGAPRWVKPPDENREEGILEMRWRWISEGFDDKIIRSLSGLP